MVIDKILETLLQRDKYKKSGINIPSMYAQNKQQISVLTNKKNEKEYIEKGYKENFQHRVMTSMMAAYEYVGYYVANQILKDYKLEGFSIPRVKGLTVDEGKLKLLIEKAPGKAVAQHLVKGRNSEDKEERQILSVGKYNIVGLPLFDLLGHIDTHEGNTILSKSGKINFIDFEAAFGSQKNLDEDALIMMINAYKSPHIKKYEKRMTIKFFNNLLKLRFINDAVIFGYIEDAIQEMMRALKNERFNVDALKLKLENIFLKGNESSIIHENILHVKEMANYAKQLIEENSINLEEAMKFPSDKYTTTSNIGKFKRGYNPVNLSKIKKVKNTKNKKMYIRKGYANTFFEEDVAAVFEYAAYRIVREVNKTTNQRIKIPRLFTLNLNDKTNAFELLTSIDFSNAKNANNKKSKKVEHFIDDILLPATPILMLLGHFDVHGGNVIVSNTDYYMIDFERAFTNITKRGQDPAKVAALKEMQKNFFKLIDNNIDNFYNPKKKMYNFKRSTLIKFVKNVSSLNIQELALESYRSLEQSEKYAFKLINGSSISNKKKEFLRGMIIEEMKEVKNTINDNFKYLENYLAITKHRPNFKRILADNNKVKEQYEKIIRPGTGEPTQTP